MAEIFDPRGDQHWSIDIPMLCAGACTRGYAVAMDSSGDVTNAATATLSAVVGIAVETGAAGDVILVRVMGYCDFIYGDGNVAATDLALCAVNGGTVVGHRMLVSDSHLGWVAPRLVHVQQDTRVSDQAGDDREQQLHSTAALQVTE